MKTFLVFTLQTFAFLGSTLVLTGEDSPRSTEAMDLARRLNTAFALTAEKAGASVVVINASGRSSFSPAESPLPWELPDGSTDSRPLLEGRPSHLNPRPTQKKAARIAFDNQGSGVVLREDGYLLTNAHVVENAETISVRFADGSECPATTKGIDISSDLAVLKVEHPKSPAAKLGNSDRVKVGEFAIAIGAPFELEATVTFGHISAKGRQHILDDNALDQDFLQTDAQINPGNSGGPLVNIEGEVIGINTLVLGSRTGIGFAIPINQAREVAEQLIRSGHYTRPWLGLGVRSLRENPEWREVFPESREGIVVKELDATGPARKSALRAGDLIIRVDGHAVETVGDFKRSVRGRPVGTQFEFEVIRNGITLLVPLRSASEPASDDPPATRSGREPGALEERDLGMLLKPVPNELAQQEGLAPGRGVLVSDVSVGSIAERCGIKVGSILTDLNRRPITGPQQFHESVQSKTGDQRLLLTILSEGSARFEALRENESR